MPTAVSKNVYWRQRVFWSVATVMLAACSGNEPVPDYAETANAVPKVEPRSKYGNPPFYLIAGKHYDVLTSSEGFVERGIASWYGPQFHGRRTSSGETYDMYAMTAAHPSLPLPTYVQVVNLENDRKTVVKVNDRGPFHDNRVIDLSYAAARKLGILSRGTGLVEVRALDPSRLVPPPAPVENIARTDRPTLFVQVGAFADPRNAEQLRAELILGQLGDIHIYSRTEAAAPLYQVRIGPLSSVDAADLTVQRLEAMGVRDFRVVVE
jgi:rare lipoprotein A